MKIYDRRTRRWYVGGVLGTPVEFRKEQDAIDFDNRVSVIRGMLFGTIIVTACMLVGGLLYAILDAVL